MPVLRAVLGVLGVLFLIGAAAVVLFGAPLPAAIAPALIGIALIVAALFERVHYKTVLPKPPGGGGWVATAERFVDPSSGRLVEVHVRLDTGERIYVDAGPAPDPHD